MPNQILTYHKTRPSHLECTLDLSQLYTTRDQLSGFKARFKEFLEADCYNPETYQLDKKSLIFDSEQLIPSKTDSRPPLLLVFGNPASHSVEEGMFFSFEGDGKEHRFWKHIMRPANILDIGLDQDLPFKEKNRLRKKRILNLNYESPYRIGFCVFVSLPSGPSGPWSGISGVHKLLGGKVMKRLVAFERRILKVVKKFMASGGKVVAFQKNAWEGLRAGSDPEYSIKLAKSGGLIGSIRDMPHIPLFGVPPTRLIGPCRRILDQFLM